MWTMWDRYTSNDWIIMLLISIIAILSIILLTGQSCDLVCAPFVISYDAIEYNVQIGRALQTEKVNLFFLQKKLKKNDFILLFQMNQYVEHIFKLYLL